MNKIFLTTLRIILDSMAAKRTFLKESFFITSNLVFIFLVKGTHFTISLSLCKAISVGFNNIYIFPLMIVYLFSFTFRGIAILLIILYLLVLSSFDNFSLMFSS